VDSSELASWFNGAISGLLGCVISLWHFSIISSVSMARILSAMDLHFWNVITTLAFWFLGRRILVEQRLC